MRKKRFWLWVLLFAALLAGCQGDGQNPAGGGAEQVPGQGSTAVPAGSAESVFQAGTWLSTGGDGRQWYYFFQEDGASGQTVSLESGIGVGFAYEYEDGQAVFHMGEADNNTRCTVQSEDGNAVTLQWEDGSTEVLTYVSALGADEFTFYADDELCELALVYYRQTSGSDSQDLTAGAAANEDGTVTVQVYENLGDHNSTAAWYIVDRFTGLGTDANSGARVDLPSAR